MLKIEINHLIDKDISTLVVDSNGATNSQFATTLRGYLREVKQASSAQHVMRMLKIYSFDAIFVDLSPQLSDGLTIIKMIRDHEPNDMHPTIIATKTSMLSQFSEAARLAGADFCTEHPIALESLLVRISKSIAKQAHSTDTSQHKFAFRH